MKIIAAGWNYASHSQELNGPIPEEPMIFCKPDSALLKDGKPFFLPDFSARIEYETELVVRIDRLGKNIAPKFAHRYYKEVTVGLDLTARDLQERYRKAGTPWELCKAFDNAAPIGRFIPLEEVGGNIQDLHFQLRKNGEVVQLGHTADMLFQVDTLIAYVSRYFTLKTGDLLFTGTPAGVGPVVIGDHLQADVEGKTLLDFYIR